MTTGAGWGRRALVPLVSCIMPTANRRRFVPQAIRLFLAQDYADKELVILDDGEDSIADLVPLDPRIRYLRRHLREPVGAKRNRACEEAHGDIIAHWDDDDWYAPQRLRLQVEALVAADGDVCGLDRVLFLDPQRRTAWEYVYPPGSGRWVCGATLCYRKSLWRRAPFPQINIGEDTRFVANLGDARVVVLPETDIFVGMVHSANTSPKHINDGRWQPRPVETIANAMGQDWPEYVNGAAVQLGRSAHRPAALVTAAAGIGDVLRVTPLIRVLDRLGHDVDLLLAPDDPATIELLRGAPELRRIIHYPGIVQNRGAQPIPELAGQEYALATFTTWSAPLARWVSAQRHYAFSRTEWLKHGDTASVDKIARLLGWHGPLPEPFAVTSGRIFDLPEGTIALHPGCKSGWPWKKWHGFDELARLLPRVAIIGTTSDLDNSATYFARPFDWPEHAQVFVGKLSLGDTAALIGQCAAVVSNDSGVMHLAVALGVPTFGIFGITSPLREIIPSRWMIPISKGLPCEAPCRQQAWGRRDCEHHLECLKMLTPDEVLLNITETLPQLPRAAPPSTKSASGELVRINYYGEVSDASGYGQAARLYIHALDRAGVKVSVINTGSDSRQIDDPLVKSLLGNDGEADFQIFHGIPPFWARTAYPLRNVIAMTVWETDTMPPQWRNPLMHAIDVWLPCTFNVEVFGSGLGRAAFRLPHPAPVPVPDGAGGAAGGLEEIGVSFNDFVFYSIFEWQERKNPEGIIEAFLRSFPQRGDPVLVLKANSAAQDVARQTLERIRGASASEGRVVLCCEAWSEARLGALHNRGDCYVSLHKGEGWGYPLFEAACRGKPVVATDFAGPLDYLDRKYHWLVRNRPTTVRQRYLYYHPGMTWAEPDIGHAGEGLQWIYQHRDEARNGAATAARQLSKIHSLERIGEAAKARLLQLLRQSSPKKASIIRQREADRLRPAVLPIPGEWYDADYFERGHKSNWERGYSWEMFKGVFRDAAAYLAEMFPEAKTFLDLGCAKGFLVRALRDRRLEAWGIDHSPWAIAQADPVAQPYLQLGDINDLVDDREFDVAVAMSIFESLTEDQIRRFLPQLRRRVRQALFATIPSLDRISDRRNAEDRDFSHITMRPRTWWHERFFEAGWHQDPVHRCFERQCQSHALPTAMGWSVYVFSPGE
jgi:Glycosyl transferase family 2/Glycosyltransferase family 9 (heptosyltransferase)/Methyltransferase domain/Glycosyl transferases group 1